MFNFGPNNTRHSHKFHISTAKMYLTLNLLYYKANHLLALKKKILSEFTKGVDRFIFTAGRSAYAFVGVSL